MNASWLRSTHFTIRAERWGLLTSHYHHYAPLAQAADPRVCIPRFDLGYFGLGRGREPSGPYTNGTAQTPVMMQQCTTFIQHHFVLSSRSTSLPSGPGQQGGGLAVSH